MNVYVENINKDRTFAEGDVMPGNENLIVKSHGCTMYGYVLTPGGKPEEKHPLVILYHGFPGVTSNLDMADALRRMGCVVFLPHYRGAWGSEGYYTFSGLIDDAVAVAEYGHSKEACDKYGIDPENIFLVGHSVGGLITINSLPRLPWVKAAVMMAPYDMPYFFQHPEHLQEFKDLLPEGCMFTQETPTSMFEDAQSCYESLAFSNGFDKLKDRNIYFIGGAKDPCAPPAIMIEPLWKQLQAHKTDAVQKYDLVNSDHGFGDMRIKLCQMVGGFIADMIG